MKAALIVRPVIVLGVDTAIGLTVMRELGQHGVPVIAVGRSENAIGRSSRYARQFFVRPKGVTLAEWLPGIIRETGAGALLAVSEGDLLDLAGRPNVIEGCRILTPRRAQLDIVLDKTRTLEVARTLGLLTPESWQPMEGEDLPVRAYALNYPVVLKWSDPPAMFARLEMAGIAFEKAEYAANPQELLACLNRYSDIGVYPMVQSWCAGYGLGQMLMMANGKARLRFQHRRLREFPASGGVSTLCGSVPLDLHSAQMEKSQALLAAIGWEGPAMVEYRYDPASGRYWLMEINGRFWGSLPLAHQCGAHFAWEQYRAAMLGAEESKTQPFRSRRARYVIPDTKRLIAILRAPDCAGPGQPRFSRMRELIAWLGEFFRFDTGYYVWSWRDPAPLLRDALGIIAKLRR